MRKQMWRSLGVLGVAVGLVVATASPASAVDGWQHTNDVAESKYDNGYSKTCEEALFADIVGIGCFQPYGEWVWLKDTRANSIPVGVQWWYFPPGSQAITRSGVIYVDIGAANGWTNLNKSFEDGGKFRFWVCQVDLPSGSVKRDSCSDIVDATT